MDRLNRTIDQRAQMVARARETILPALRAVDPTATIEDALALITTGQMSKDRGAAASGFTLGPDETRFDPTGKELAHGKPKPPTATDLDIDKQIVAAYNAGNQPELNRLLALKRQSSAAGRAPTAADAESPEALAEMVADNPNAMPGTPTQQGAVMAAIAKNPALRARFEAAQLKPVREQATTIVGALKGLVKVDEATGKVTGLQPGAAGLYGMGTGRLARFYPGSATATAKADLDQLIGTQILNLIGEMKKQSRSGATGFGALNARELDVLEQSATILKGEISEPRALQELKKLYEKFSLIMQPGANEKTTPAGGAGAGAASAAGGRPPAVDLNTPVFIGPDGRPQIGAPAGAR